jgi:hypothetical protein
MFGCRGDSHLIQSSLAIPLSRINTGRHEDSDLESYTSDPSIGTNWKETLAGLKVSQEERKLKGLMEGRWVMREQRKTKKVVKE